MADDHDPAPDIPAREVLETFPRAEIQKLCKDHGVRANMRTDEMITALCDLVIGKDVPRPHRATSQSISERVPSQPPPSKSHPTPTAPATKKAALQPSESNTDAESVSTSEPPSAPPARRTTKAKDIQTHLGKGRPAVAGGSGARSITVSRRGSSASIGGRRRRTKTSAMLQEAIIEEDEENTNTNGETNTPEASGSNNAPTARPSSTRPLSPHPPSPSQAADADQPSHLPTPAPSQPSYSLPSVQLSLSALEDRVKQLEVPRIQDLEVAIADIAALKAALAELPILKATVAELPTLKAAVAEMKTAVAELPALRAAVGQVPILQAELHRLRGLETEVHRLQGLEADLQHVKALQAEVSTLRARVADLERMDKDTSMRSVIVHSLDDELQSDHDHENNDNAPPDQNPTKPRTLANAALPNPSPSQPTLGKRTRSATDTPDASAGDEPAATPQDASLEAIHRVVRPQRKRARLEGVGAEKDGEAQEEAPFLLKRTTSTPRQPQPGQTHTHQQTQAHSHSQRRSDSPPSFFAGQRPATPLLKAEGGDAEKDAEKEGDLDLDLDLDMGAYITLEPEGVTRWGGEGFPATPTARPQIAGPSTLTTTAGPSTPPNPTTPTPHTPYGVPDFATPTRTPMLGAPWRFHEQEYTDAVRQHEGPGAVDTSHLVGAAPRPTFRALHSERYNPYFTPGARVRTGLTPLRGFSGAGLKSPVGGVGDGDGAHAPGRAGQGEGGGGGNAEGEAAEGEGGGEEGVLRTLYGTELEGDTRFGDYGRDLGRFDWGRYGLR